MHCKTVASIIALQITPILKKDQNINMVVFFNDSSAKSISAGLIASVQANHSQQPFTTRLLNDVIQSRFRFNEIHQRRKGSNTVYQKVYSKVYSPSFPSCSTITGLNTDLLDQRSSVREEEL